MELLFDLKAAQGNISGKRHGGGKYAEIVFKRIVERGLPVSCFYDSTRWLNPEIEKILEEKKISCYDIKDCTIDSLMEKFHFDRVYSALPINVYDVQKGEVYGTIHGLREFETPVDGFFLKYKGQYWKDVIRFFLQKYIPSIGYWWDWKRDKKYLNKQNFHFCTVSNHSACSFRSYFPEVKDREIRVFYSPSTSSKIEIDKRVYQEKFFLLVSANRWEKNNLRAIMALDRLFTMGYLEGFRVKVTGVQSSAHFRYKLVNKGRFDFLGYVEDDVLEQLYHDAYSFVYPSLNEGFGYPPLEAMRYGIPVIASPFSSISEICQGAVLYANPLSVEEIMARILYVTKQDVYEALSEKARLQYQLITAKQETDLDLLIDYLYE